MVVVVAAVVVAVVVAVVGAVTAVTQNDHCFITAG